MITAHDMAARVAMPAAAYAPLTPHHAGVAAVVPFRERLLIVVLFITVLLSSVAFIEPSPHDVMMGVLAVAGLVAGIRFHRILLLPFLLLLGWNVAGLMSVIQVPEQEKTIQFAATSIYLAVAAMLFAMIFADNTMVRMATMRRAYILTAAIIALCGAAGYFGLPGASMFVRYGRALGAFKDPNVYGPFLILPLLFLIARMMTRRIDLLSLVATGIIAFGLLLGFSRGSWFHFGVSAAVMIGLLFLTAPTPKARMRVFGMSLAAVGALALLLMILLSIDSIGSMFKERAQLIQYYDVGQGGRFRLQEMALSAVLDFPNGMGPFEFARIYGLQQHNVYLQAFLVYGWAGALSYIMLLIATCWVGLRTALMRTPWQIYSIAALGAFVGEMAEGVVIDTDHWRHFFLILGIIWGLAAA
ncbi:MAG: O-antigen ligase domain-containing protein, partial [Pseudolabrys sp.]|nr:O-antigen ligase domain-containing protein [Pseudolabrys sp.]